MTIQQEIEKAREYNYGLLFNYIRGKLIDKHKDDIGIFVELINGAMDEMTHDTIEEMKQNQLIDEMYMPTESV